MVGHVESAVMRELVSGGKTIWNAPDKFRESQNGVSESGNGKKRPPENNTATAQQETNKPLQNPTTRNYNQPQTPPPPRTRGTLRCARTGCPNPQQNPDPYQLGLCATHNHQFATGTIGHNHNTRKRQHNPTQPRHQLQTIRQPGESIRHLATRIGLSKDAVRKILNGQSHTIRSHAYTAIQNAAAQQTYDQQHNPHQLQLFQEQP